MGAGSNCALPVRLERNLYGSSIAVAIHSLDRTYRGLKFRWALILMRLSGAVGTESLSHQQKRTKTGLVSNSRGLVDLLVGDVGVKFPVEVVVFAVHLVTEVVDSRIYIRIESR